MEIEAVDLGVTGRICGGAASKCRGTAIGSLHRQVTANDEFADGLVAGQPLQFQDINVLILTALEIRRGTSTTDLRPIRNFLVWLHTREPVYGFRVSGEWHDIGDLGQLLAADNLLRERAGLPMRTEYTISEKS